MSRSAALALLLLLLAGCGPSAAGLELRLDGQGLAPPGLTDYQIAFLTSGAPEDCAGALTTAPQCLKDFLAQAGRATAPLLDADGREKPAILRSAQAGATSQRESVQVAVGVRYTLVVEGLGAQALLGNTCLYLRDGVGAGQGGDLTLNAVTWYSPSQQASACSGADPRIR
ncbi:MAG TPA: hypothetical protein VND93_33055 [Myxococcales bacterium]|nr:hypothetical protein [Myxococcales bacterium]